MLYLKLFFLIAATVLLNADFTKFVFPIDFWIGILAQKHLVYIILKNLWHFA